MVVLNTIKLALNNIKKSKNSSVILAIMIMLSIIFLYLGTSVVLNIGPFYADKVKEYNGASISAVTKDSNIYDKSYKIIDRNPHTKKIETEDTLIFDTTTFKSDKKDISTAFFICNADNKRDISILKYVGKTSNKKENGIILSYNLKAQYGYNIGDKFQIKSKTRNLNYTVYGFFEDTLYNNITDTLSAKAYLFNNDYNKLKDSLPEDNKGKIIKAKTDNMENALNIKKTCIKELFEDSSGKPFYFDCTDIKDAGESLNGYIGIIMSILIAFSLILVLIALIVIAFSIVTYIEDNIKNIGVLQAIGYLSKQVINISLVQFIMIAVLGSIIGLFIAIGIMPFVSNIVSSIAGLRWTTETNYNAAFISISTLLILVFIVTYLSARKIKKITPIIALRSGVTTHSFKKNHVKLEGYKGNLNFAIALKTIFSYLRQNLMMIVIVSVVTFVSIFSTITYYNFVVNDNVLINMIGIEKVDLLLEDNNGISNKIYNEMKDNSKVRKVVKLWDKSILFNDENTRLYVCDNYSKLENKIIFSGREPIHDNEIAISSALSNTLNKKIGDTIDVKINKIKRSFLIVGISQHMTGYGRSLRITYEGYKRYDNNFTFPSIGVYLKNNADVKGFIKDLNAKYQNKNIKVTDYKVLLESITKSLKAAIKLCVIVFIIVAVAVICLVLLLLIKIRILKERNHLGLLKALGFTTKQLIFQMVFSIMPVIIIGVIIGIIFGCLFSNSLMAAVMTSLGIHNCNLQINNSYIAFVFTVIISVTLLFSALVSRKVRKITPYELMDK